MEESLPPHTRGFAGVLGLDNPFQDEERLPPAFASQEQPQQLEGEGPGDPPRAQSPLERQIAGKSLELAVS